MTQTPMHATTPTYLRSLLIETASKNVEPTIENLESRPIFFLAPLSMVGCIHGPSIAAATKGLVAVVDDWSKDETIYGAPRWTSREFLDRIGDYKGALALDFSGGHTGRAMFAALCRHAGVERVDCVVAQAQLGLHSVYETARDYRTKTLARLDEFLALANRLADDHSKATLYGNLLFRLTYDRSHMLSTWANPIEEYFSPYGEPATFRLGTHEHYVDCGAYQGPIVSKFLGATGFNYGSITAFEPDRTNFEVLKRVSPVPLANFRPINKAVSNRAQTVRFAETGTMSSHVTETGGIEVQTAKLDEELDQLTFLKMDVEGFEPKTLEGAAGLIARHRPRIAACVYHYAHDFLDVLNQIEKTVDGYHYRLQQHNGSYYYDLVLYASPVAGVEPPESAA